MIIGSLFMVEAHYNANCGYRDYRWLDWEERNKYSQWGEHAEEGGIVQVENREGGYDERAEGNADEYSGEFEEEREAYSYNGYYRRDAESMKRRRECG